jgi:hypothetical protein
MESVARLPEEIRLGMNLVARIKPPHNPKILLAISTRFGPSSLLCSTAPLLDLKSPVKLMPIFEPSWSRSVIAPVTRIRQEHSATSSVHEQRWQYILYGLSSAALFLFLNQ